MKVFLENGRCVLTHPDLGQLVIPGGWHAALQEWRRPEFVTADACHIGDGVMFAVCGQCGRSLLSRGADGHFPAKCERCQPQVKK